MDHRIGEFEIAIFDGDAGEFGLQGIGQDREFTDRELIATTVAAQHDTGARRQ